MKEFTKWWMWVLMLGIPTIMLLMLMSYMGVFTSTVVERKVFEESYQRSEGLKSQIATYEAQLAEIETQLAGAELSPRTRADLEAQRAAIRVQLRAARAL